MIQTYTITTPEYGKVVDWLEEILTGMKVTRREIFVAELLLEENFYRLAEASGTRPLFPPGSTSGSVSATSTSGSRRMENRSIPLKK